MKDVSSVELIEKGGGVGRFSLQCPGVEKIADKLVKLVSKKKWALFELKPASLSLEEVFLKLTGKGEGE